jgi:predicted dehydrogenase
VGDALRVGMVGIGNISGQYLATLPRLPGVSLVAAADLDPSRQVPGVPTMTPAELYAADDVDLVLNLTIPRAHAEVALSAIAAGKHVYNEKPLALSTVEGSEVLAAAAAAGVRVGCAPDTVLGTGTQTARRCIDDGMIGQPVAATAFMVTPGHERWHPAPEFYYQPGGGPLFDMGPYYLTALVTLLGPVRRVTGLASTPRLERVIGQGPRAGTTFPVAVPTHVTGTLEHENGVLTTLLMSFDVWAASLHPIEVYGTGGSLSVPDPNNFAGEVRVFTPETAGRPDSGWTTVGPSAGHRDAGRGTGVADLAQALATNTEHRANGALAYHVLDVMESLLRATETGTTQDITSTCPRPAPVP